MRTLLNLPLVLALLLGGWAFVATVFGAPPVGGQRSMEEGIYIFLAIAVSWLLLAGVLAGCAGVGGFKGLGISGGGGVLVALLVLAGIVVVELLPIGITLEDNAAAKWGIDQVGAARLAAFGLPLLLALYAGWAINAPEGLRDAPASRYGWPGAVGVLCLVAAVVSVREMGRWDKVAAVRAVEQGQRDAARADEQRQALAALTDADPLFSWDAYVGYDVPEDVRTEALRRMALRPHLEDDLAEALASENTLWTREALSLVVRIPFRPTAALEKPLRGALAVIAEEIRQRPTSVPAVGNSDLHDDTAVDAYETSTLRSTLAVAVRMAETARVDLSDTLDAMQQAVAVSKTSDAARSFPGQVADAKKRIAAILAARPG